MKYDKEHLPEWTGIHAFIEDSPEKDKDAPKDHDGNGNDAPEDGNGINDACKSVVSEWSYLVSDFID